MKIDDFDYHLPEEMIARYPLATRDDARLLVLHRHGEIEHKFFYDLPDLLEPDDLLVFNDSMVINARVRAEKKTGGKVEFLLIERKGDNTWWCLGRGRIRPGSVVYADRMQGTVLKKDGNRYLVEFDGDPEEIGEIPLPPYIKRAVEPLDATYYQNVYAEERGSVAAATAGLHFTEGLLKRLNEKGVDHAMITCHIRPGIFQRVKNIDDFQMTPEPFRINEETVVKIKKARRLIAVGTSVVRVIEGFGSGTIKPDKALTRIFISPGFRFNKISGMITNFHLPKSPPLIMTASFIGLERLKEAYQVAIDHGYRFLSYGDGMLII